MSTTFNTINTQITRLAPILNTVTITPGATVSNPTIHVMTKRSGGSTYVLAVNENGSSKSVTFQVPGFSGGTAAVDGESRSLTVTGGSLTDTFAAYAVHIYKID